MATSKIRLCGRCIAEQFSISFRNVIVKDNKVQSDIKTFTDYTYYPCAHATFNQIRYHICTDTTSSKLNTQ